MQDGAACASHLSRQSVGTCSRCGRFTCEACAKSDPCLECQVLQRSATPPLSSVFEVLIGICAVLSIICTVITTAAIGELDFTKLTEESLSSGPMIFFFAVEFFYMAVWFAFAGVWLGWYSAMIDWARSRGAAMPGNLTAIALCFVPGINLGHPLVTLRTIRAHTGVRTPLDWWWWLFLGSIVVSTLGGVQEVKGPGPFIIAGTVMEIVAAILCWAIVRDFRLADRAWDPRGAIELRDRPATT